MRNYFQYTFHKRALLFWLASFALNACIVGVCNYYNKPVLAYLLGYTWLLLFAAYCIGNFLQWHHYRHPH